MDLNIEQLGFTKEELQDRVVSRIADSILSSVGYDPDEGETTVESKFAKTVEKKCREHIDSVINHVAEKHLSPNVEKFIADLTLQETTSWGEKRGEPLSFIGYLTKRAEAYMSEMVNFEGKDKAQSGSYSFSGTQTRLTHIVHKHLHYSIESAMKDSIGQLNKAIVPALEATVKAKLSEISSTLKAAVTTK
jgi:hypothetical protein